MNHDELHSILESFGTERRIHYSLDRFQEALVAVGNPHKSVKSLVISGTNGKGSTTLLTAAALVEAGFNVGTYLSPHLQQVNERVLHNLSPVSALSLIGLAQELHKVGKKYELSYFEFLTLLYFVWAERAKLDFSVLEVGLGGRLDATNVTDPIACAITNIDFDHQQYLGDTLPQILSEKLGILNSEGLLFTGIHDVALLAQVEKRCEELDAIYYYSRELRKEVISKSWDGQQIRINGHPFSLTNPSTGALHNASLAFLLVRIVFPTIPLSTMQRAFASVRIPGRMEVIQESPRVVLSGDHNPAGIRSLLETLKDLAYSDLHTVCAFSADKPFSEMYRALGSVSKSITLTKIRPNEPISESYAAMADVAPDPKTAVQTVLAKAKPTDTILVTGSLYLIGEVRSLWRERVEFAEGSTKGSVHSISTSGGSNRAKFPLAAQGQSHAPQGAGAER